MSDYSFKDLLAKAKPQLSVTDGHAGGVADVQTSKKALDRLSSLEEMHSCSCSFVLRFSFYVDDPTRQLLVLGTVSKSQACVEVHDLVSSSDPNNDRSVEHLGCFKMTPEVFELLSRIQKREFQSLYDHARNV